MRGGERLVGDPIDRMETSTAEVLDHFAARSARARRAFDVWMARSGAAKREWVLATRTSVAYTLTPDAVQDVCRRTVHPLGNIKKSEIEGVEIARDWHPDFALQHALHHAVEMLRRIPTFQEFQNFCSHDELAIE